MIVNFMHFLPCFTCLALALIHLFSRRERRNARFVLLTALFAIYFFADASYYTLDVSPGMWAALDIVSQFVSLWVIPASVSFLILECGDDLQGTSTSGDMFPASSWESIPSYST